MKIRIKFRKQGAMKFIGHLDTMRYFQKAMRRAEVDICYSGGFSPHQIMSFAAPLGVGLLSNGEYLDIEAASSDSSAAMVRRMNQVMSEGIEVLSWRKLDDAAPSAMSLVAAADYILAFRPGKEPEDAKDFFAGLEEFCGRKELRVVKKTKHGEKEMDLRPLIYRAERIWALPADGEKDSASAGAGVLDDGRPVMISGAAAAPSAAIFLRLSAGSADNVKPELVIDAFCEASGRKLAPFALQAERQEVYAAAETGGENQFVPLEALGEEIEQTDHYQD